MFAPIATPVIRGLNVVSEPIKPRFEENAVEGVLSNPAVKSFRLVASAGENPAPALFTATGRPDAAGHVTADLREYGGRTVGVITGLGFQMGSLTEMGNYRAARCLALELLDLARQCLRDSGAQLLILNLPNKPAYTEEDKAFAALVKAVSGTYKYDFKTVDSHERNHEPRADPLSLDEVVMPSLTSVSSA